jgi:uncharacterized protein YggE
VKQLFAVLTLMAVAWAGGAQDARIAAPPAVTVVGEGRVSADPDRAIVRLGATIQREDAASAQRELDAVMQRATDAIVALGIARASVQTSSLTLRPIYANDEPTAETGAQRARRAAEPRIVAYRATNVVRVTVDDLRLVGGVIDAGITAGANEIRGVSFALQNDLPYRLNAIERAAEVALQKARAVSSALGVRLTEPLDVREQSAVIPYRELDERFARAELGAAAAIEPGEIAVEASVELRYGIERNGAIVD